MEKPKIIHVFGASGSGTTTLAQAIASRFGYFHMDTDDYFWLPTDPKFIRKRDRGECLALMKRDMERHEKAVISGSLCKWGDSLIPYFDLVIRVVTPEDVRIRRLKAREAERFADRIRPGGDMYETHIAFLEWAAKYDRGGTEMRSRAQHDLRQSKLACEVLTVNGELPLDVLLEQLGL